MTPEAPRWRKSSRSTASGTDCVEVSGALVRDSKNAAGPVLSFPAATWRGFLASAKVAM